MKLEQSFDVEAPVEQVWTALMDLERVAPCLPGAQITGRDEDGTYHGTFQVKLGPTTAAYRGTIRIEAADEATHTATLAARGTDKRGQGGANATIVNRLTERAGGGTTVAATTDFTITGRLARFGRGGMMQDISNRLLRDFAACLATRLADGPDAAPGGAQTAAPPAGEAAAGAAIAPAGEGTAPAEETPPADEGTAPADETPAADEGTVPADETPAADEGEPDTRVAAATPPPAPPPPAAVQPVKGGSLFLSVLWERIRRLFRRG